MAVVVAVAVAVAVVVVVVVIVVLILLLRISLDPHIIRQILNLVLILIIHIQKVSMTMKNIPD